MSKNYSGEGHTINITLAAVATAGVPITIGTFLAVPITDGIIGEVIACSIMGVFNIPKADAAVIAQGETITWDVSAGNADDNLAVAASGDLTLGCVAMEGKGATTGESILVKINQGVNTVTP